MRQVYHLNFIKRLCVIPVYGLLRLWYLTLRIKMDEATQNLFRSNESVPQVFYFWHHNLFVAPMLRKLRKHRPMYGLMSASKDGAWLEALVKWFKVMAIRGSSSWRGSMALHELEQRKCDICDIIITPDGPKGPCCVCKPGSVKWALEHRYRIASVHFSMHRFWCLKSWDHFKIPMPFSSITIAAESLPSDLDVETTVAALNSSL